MDTLRIESDSIGSKAIPPEAYYGVQSLRAKENFPITFLWALEENHNAIRFYERHGFRLSGIRKPTKRGTEYLVHLERI